MARSTITVSEITSTAGYVDIFVTALKVRLDEITTKLTALKNSNPLPSDAREQYNILAADREVISNEWNNYTTYSTLLDLASNASSSVQQTVAVQEALDNTKDLVTNFVNNALTQKNSLFPEVEQIITTAQQSSGNGDSSITTNPNGTTANNKNAVPNEDGAPSPTTTTTNNAPPPAPGTVPGKRSKNPLGWFSSYNYQLSWYMVSPQGFNLFQESGRTRLPPAGQYYTIAQSGGIGPEERPPTNVLPYDFFIDNLKITAAVGVAAAGSQTFVQDIDFTITEPYGFSLTKRIKQVGNALKLANQNNTTAGAYSDIENDIKQIFIIGIRFLGYDKDGNIMSGNNQYGGQTLDPSYNSTTSLGIFERYFAVRISEFKFSLDGKATIYQIKTTGIDAAEAGGVKRGILNEMLKVEASTVEEAINAVLAKKNAEQDKLIEDKGAEYKAVYSINSSFPGASEILKASLLSPEEVDKSRAPTNPAQTTTQVNENRSARSNPNFSKILYTFNPGEPLLQIFEKLITASSYLRDGLRVVFDSKTEPSEKEDENENTPDTRQPVRWFNISPELKNARFDPKLKDWVYDITYIIKPYETPVSVSVVANKLTPLYEPFKQYEYWYTGENSEIISYRQEINNAFFLITLAPELDTDGQSSGGAQVPLVTNQKQNVDATGRKDKGFQAQAELQSSLQDPASFASARITIFGDPDWLMQPTESSNGLDQEIRKWYGPDGNTVNPTSGQVLITIIFKEPKDYGTEKGLLEINQNIIFWDYPDWVKPQLNGGISYQVANVTSSFSGGKFTQVLECVLNTFSDKPPTGSA